MGRTTTVRNVIGIVLFVSGLLMFFGGIGGLILPPAAAPNVFLLLEVLIGLATAVASVAMMLNKRWGALTLLVIMALALIQALIQLIFNGGTLVPLPFVGITPLTLMIGYGVTAALSVDIFDFWPFLIFAQILPVIFFLLAGYFLLKQVAADRAATPTLIDIDA